MTVEHGYDPSRQRETARRMVQDAGFMDGEHVRRVLKRLAGPPEHCPFCGRPYDADRQP